MGLIRATAKAIPYAAIGLLGYYVGTIKSDQYDSIFQNDCVAEYMTIEENSELSELEESIINQIDVR
jgi:hypothetical protein